MACSRKPCPARVLHPVSVGVRRSASAILGFVGAGGLGQQIELSMRMFNFHEVVTLVFILFGLVTVVDVLSARARKAIR